MSASAESIEFSNAVAALGLAIDVVATICTASRLLRLLVGLSDQTASGIVLVFAFVIAIVILSRPIPRPTS